MKELNIGEMKLSIPDYNSDVWKAIELLQNEYESGNVRAIFLVCATKRGIVSSIVGDGMVLPFATMSAGVIAEQVLDNIMDSLVGEVESDE